MSQLGRISGQLLKDNLTRNGHDLTFDDDLLHLDVTNRRIGIKTVTPQNELDVNGTTRTTDLEVTNQADIADLTISGTTITSNTGTLNLTNGTGDQVNYQTKLVVDNIDINDNVISTNDTDVNLELRPNGTGSVDVYADTNVYGNIYATGNIRADGNITVGDANTDNITINADVNSNIVPDVDSTYQLGSGGTKYESGTDYTLGDATLTVSGSGTSVVLSIPASGPTWVDDLTDDAISTVYELVLDSGSSAYILTTTALWTGSGPQTVTTTNDSISDGTYNVISIRYGMKRWLDLWAQNIYADNVVSGGLIVDGVDLTLRPGNIYFVSTNGSDSVTVTGTHQNDPFLTVKHALSMTSSGDTVFIYPGTYLETFPLTIPAGVTVKGHSLRSVLIEPTIATIDLDAFLINGEVTVEDITIGNFRYNATNNTGYAFRLANNFLVTSRSPYIKNVTVISKGSATSSGDPYGFDSDDAGKGVLADGSVADASSKEVSLLFNNVTFITPNQECVTATNGVRIEWLNSFTYFADKGLNLLSGSTGFAGAGLTRLRIDTRTGSWNVGDTISYYDTDGVTVLGTGVIDSIDGDYINLTGKCSGFQTITDRIPTTLYAQGGAKLSTAEKKFGTASLALDGVGDYVTHPTAPDFEFGTGDFTLECWVYTNSITATNIILDFRTTSTQAAPAVGCLSNGSLFYYVNGVSVITGSAGDIATGTWNHIALVKASGSTSLYLNGNQIGTTYTDGVTYIESPLTIGSAYVGTAGFVNGYIDDVRISKGVARYTGTFTAPTAALTGDLDTVLLLHFNGADNSTTFLDDGITLQDIRNTTTSGSATVINFADYSDFGVEVRAISSANVYGNYGIYGDGEGVIAYLISQNFAYIGSGKLSTNDPNDAIHANEITELNNAKIYYTSVDHEGTFNVGDFFYVNQKTGDVTFNGNSFNVTAATGVTFTDGVNTTTITPTTIDTGNIRISGNTIESVTGDVIVTAASGAINLQNNTFITGDLDVTGDINLGGNITIGDQSTDTISFVAGITSNLVPATTAFYDLGTDLLRWQTAYLNRAEIDGVVIDSNTISTTVGNDNLTLSANGSGKILVPSNNVQIDQALTVNGTTTLKGTTVNGNITQTGNVTQTGDFTQIGDTEITGNLTVSSFAQFEKIKIDLNTIATTTTDTDLILEAAGTGKIYIPSNDVLIDQNLTVNGTVSANSLDVTGNITANSFSTDDILIQDNYITTTVTGSDLELIANGTGIISIPSNDVQMDQALTTNGDLTVTTGLTSLKDTSITGTITQTGGDIDQTGNFTTSGLTEVTGNITATGYLEMSDITISGNVVEVTTTDTDLDLRPNGTGNVIFEDIRVTNNTFASTGTNQDIVLQPQGIGSVIVNTNQSLIIPVGTDAQRPATPTNGMIRYNTDRSVYEGWNATYSQWLQLSGVTDLDGNTKITAELTPGANDNIIRFYANGNLTATIDSSKLYAERFQTSGTDINGNTISALTVNTDLNLTTSGTGGVKVGNLTIKNNTITNTVSGAITQFTETGTGYVKITGTNGVVIPSGDLTQLPSVRETGMVRFNTYYQYVEVFDGTTWVNASGSASGVSLSQAQDIGIVSALLFG